MIRLIKENKELMEAIRNILQVFPESVIIQSVDSNNKKTLFKYANKAAVNNILLNSSYEDKDYVEDATKVKVVNQENSEDQFLELEKLLDRQIEKIRNFNEENDSFKSFVEIAEPYFNTDQIFEDTSDESTRKFYTVKSLKVTWDKNEESFMHIFIDTTNVRKLEEEKTKNRLQKLMFSSISHEFRTPLNAFDNSLYLIQSKFDDLLTDIGGLIEPRLDIKKSVYK